MMTIPAPACHTPMTWRRRWAALGLLALLLLTGATPSWAAGASTPELAFLQLVNSERASRGLSPLKLSPVISDELSRPWSTTMARRNALAHSGSGAQVLTAVSRRYPGVSTAGENVGYAPTVAALHRALMASPGHRANIVDRDFRFVGLGVASSNQRVWVTQTFFTTKGAAVRSAPPPSPAPTSAIAARWGAPPRVSTGTGRPAAGVPRPSG